MKAKIINAAPVIQYEIRDINKIFDSFINIMTISEKLMDFIEKNLNICKISSDSEEYFEI